MVGKWMAQNQANGKYLASDLRILDGSIELLFEYVSNLVIYSFFATDDYLNNFYYIHRAFRYPSNNHLKSYKAHIRSYISENFLLLDRLPLDINNTRVHQFTHCFPLATDIFTLTEETGECQNYMLACHGSKAFQNCALKQLRGTVLQFQRIQEVQSF